MAPIPPDSDDYMDDEDEADKEDIDKALAAVDMSGDQADVRERFQAQWREVRRKRIRTSKRGCTARAPAAS